MPFLQTQTILRPSGLTKIDRFMYTPQPDLAYTVRIYPKKDLLCPGYIKS